MPQQRSAMSLDAFILLAIALLAPACGGGSGDGGLSGQFVDSPVAGLRYSAGSRPGTTTSLGRFTYKAGETITFSIGDTDLPTVPAGPLITPLTIFETADFADVRVVNLARLLQTLDSDGNAANGITLTAAAHAAATGQPVIDFSSATFDTDATIVNLLASGGGAGTLVSAGQATAHLKSQTLVGSWYILLAPGAHSSSVKTFLAEGTYLQAEDGDPGTDPSGTDGMERGTWTWNPTTGAFSINIKVDTCGEWGLSHPQGAMTASITGDTLSLTDDSGTTNLTRMGLSPTSALVGSWKMIKPLGQHSTVVVTFFDSMDYMMAEDGNPSIDPSGMDGMERGTYTWNSGTGAFTATATVSTNGSWGWDGSNTTLTVVGDELWELGVPTGFTRVIP